jgi:hypothetical protein
MVRVTVGIENPERYEEAERKLLAEQTDAIADHCLAHLDFLLTKTSRMNGRNLCYVKVDNPSNFHQVKMLEETNIPQLMGLYKKLVIKSLVYKGQR